MLMLDIKIVDFTISILQEIVLDVTSRISLLNSISTECLMLRDLLFGVSSLLQSPRYNDFLVNHVAVCLFDNIDTYIAIVNDLDFSIYMHSLRDILLTHYIKVSYE